MLLNLNENFIEKIAELEDFEQFYAALWIVSGIKHKKRRMNGAALLKIAKKYPHDMRVMDIYKIGYVQALIDLGQPLKYKNKPYTSQSSVAEALTHWA